MVNSEHTRDTSRSRINDLSTILCLPSREYSGSSFPSPDSYGWIVAPNRNKCFCMTSSCYLFLQQSWVEHGHESQLSGVCTDLTWWLVPNLPISGVFTVYPPAKKIHPPNKTIALCSALWLCHVNLNQVKSILGKYLRHLAPVLSSSSITIWEISSVVMFCGSPWSTQIGTFHAARSPIS